jgi:hypothetical protein
MGQPDDWATRSNRSWLADALDPTENLRAMADVQAFGRRAAEELADRILAWGDGGAGTGGGAPGADGSTGPALADAAERLRADVLLAGEVSARLVDHVMTVLGIVVEQWPSWPRGGPDASTAAADGLSVEALPGTATSTLLWVHNTAAAAVAAVRPHCSPPRSHLGRDLADAVTFDPPVLDPVPPRSTCGIEVRVQVPADAEPGSYLSVVMATNLPDLSLPLRVTVLDAGAAG